MQASQEWLHGYPACRHYRRCKHRLRRAVTATVQTWKGWHSKQAGWRFDAVKTPAAMAARPTDRLQRAHLTA